MTVSKMAVRLPLLLLLSEALMSCADLTPKAPPVSCPKAVVDTAAQVQKRICDGYVAEEVMKPEETGSPQALTYAHRMDVFMQGVCKA